jgi:hypothetical protein
MTRVLPALAALLLTTSAMAQMPDQRQPSVQEQIDGAEASIMRTIVGLGNAIAANVNQLGSATERVQTLTKERDAAKADVGSRDKTIADKDQQIKDQAAKHAALVQDYDKRVAAYEAEIAALKAKAQ